MKRQRLDLQPMVRANQLPHRSSRSGDTPPRICLFLTVGRYAAKDMLVSGWLEGGEVIAGRAAIVQVGVGTGRAVLVGFSPQHRGQSHATFRLLFNAIFTARSDQPSAR
jgi:hypothetical protein